MIRYASAALALVAFTSVAADTPLFTLDVDTGAGIVPAMLARQSNGVVRVDAIYNGTMNTTAKVRLLPFNSETVGGALPIGVLPDCDQPNAARMDEISITATPGASIPICLNADPIPPGAKFTGRLVIAPVGAMPIYRPIALTSPKAADGMLVVDHTTLTQTVSRPWYPWPFNRGATAEATVVVREKTGAIVLQGLSVRLEQVTASPESGFDLKRNVDFELNGQKVDLVVLAQPAANRDLNGGQATVRLLFHDLDAGDYTGVLRFTATNSALDDAQKLTVAIHVRDSILWALACLIVALIISLISTKVLTSQRRRAAVLEQIHSLPPLWFALLEPSAAVVWVRATLHQVRSFTRKRQMTFPDSIEGNVADVKKMLGVLDTIRQVREKLKLALDPLIFDRAMFLLNSVAERVGGAALDDAQVAAINADLKTFDDWLNPDRLPSACWKVIAKDVEGIQDLLARNTMPPETQPMINEGLAAIEAALKTPPATRKEINDVYRQYIRLRLLFEHRDNVRDLIAPATAFDVARMSELTDQRAWELLKTSKITIRMPESSSADTLETYQILRFTAETDNPVVSDSFVFKNKVEFRWIFKVYGTTEAAEGKNGDNYRTRLTPRSIGPAILQYFPQPGKLSAHIELVYRGDTIPSAWTAGPMLQNSSDDQARAIRLAVEHSSWLIAGVVAIATALSTFYFKNAAWGTYQDYLMLFLWGVGFDQGKNFVQALGITSGTQPAPPVAGH